MKKIINGKKYDTETAELLGRITSGEPRSWQYSEEALYRKKNGEYFFLLEGSVISTSLMHIYPGIINVARERIEPTSERVAKNWAEENLGGDQYEKIFGEVEE